jgi:uncharacterized protein (DUF58 family)
VALLQQLHEEVLDRLAGLGIAARQAVENVLAGKHRSVRKGLSVEFVGHRPYEPGDDLRRLDWLVYARSDRFDVRQYEEETRLRATILVDCSGSMGYGSATRTKLEFARMLAGALCFLLIRQSDSVALVTCDTAVREQTPAASTMPHLFHLLERLEATRPGGETSLGDVLQDVASRLRHRGLVVLLSDAFDDVDRLGKAFQRLRFQKQDVRLFQIVDPEEERFSLSGPTEFVGLEGEPRLRLEPPLIRKRYQEAFADHRKLLRERCHEAHVRLDFCHTREDLSDVLMRALSQIAPTMGRT